MWEIEKNMPDSFYPLKDALNFKTGHYYSSNVHVSFDSFFLLCSSKLVTSCQMLKRNVVFLYKVNF